MPITQPQLQIIGIKCPEQSKFYPLGHTTHKDIHIALPPLFSSHLKPLQHKTPLHIHPPFYPLLGRRAPAPIFLPRPTIIFSTFLLSLPSAHAYDQSLLPLHKPLTWSHLAFSRYRSLYPSVSHHPPYHALLAHLLLLQSTLLR